MLEKIRDYILDNLSYNTSYNMTMGILHVFKELMNMYPELKVYDSYGINIHDMSLMLGDREVEEVLDIIINRSGSFYDAEYFIFDEYEDRFYWFEDLEETVYYYRDNREFMDVVSATILHLSQNEEYVKSKACFLGNKELHKFLFGVEPDTSKVEVKEEWY